ncbi:hypothetical protein J6590_081595 [Homalodisca vitripennis]|nr:hypothetical protein J6590_081595 [Homalodisca vitripennis]
MIEPGEFVMHGVYIARTLTKIEQNCCWVKTVNVSVEVTLVKNQKLGSLVSDIASEEDQQSARCRLVILADSHDRGLQSIVSERLPRNVDVEVFFLPNGGTNDVDKTKPYPLTLQQAFVALPTKWEATVKVLSIFYRYDKDLKTELSDANGLLKAIVQNLTKQSRGKINFLDLKGEMNRRW